MTRPITPSDLWSAIRGCGMYRMTRAELAALVSRYTDPANPFTRLFASAVLAEAARQVLATRTQEG